MLKEQKIEIKSKSVQMSLFKNGVGFAQIKNKAGLRSYFVKRIESHLQSKRRITLCMDIIIEIYFTNGSTNRMKRCRIRF